MASKPGANQMGGVMETGAPTLAKRSFLVRGRICWYH